MPRVLVPLAQGCEELEAITITDLFVRAGFEVITAGLDNQAVIASRGTVITPATDLDTAMQQDYDMIVLPGGLPGADHLNADNRIQHLVSTMFKNGKFVAAICAAPKVLATAGILRGKRATAYPGTLEAMNLDNITVTDEPIVRDDNVITSRGPGTAMDFALTLIELLEDTSTRKKVESGLVR